MKVTTYGNNLIQLTRLPLLFPVNCYLVREDDGFTLIDTGLPRKGEWSRDQGHVGSVPIRVRLRDASPYLAPSFQLIRADKVPMTMYRGARYGRAGFGVPVVLISPRCDDRPICELLPPSGVFRWATAWVESGEGDEPPRLVLAHPVRSDPHVHGGRAWPLAVDSSAFYAAGLSDSPIARLSILGLFGGDGLGRRTGVYLLEDYDPAKRPLIMVHGLGSSPLAWARLSNAVWGDPELRRRYQVWQLVYQTRDPILVARSRVQVHLDRAWHLLDPEGDDAARGGMVLVGHSMGGVLSRLMLVRARDELWNAAFLQPASALDAEADEIAALENFFRFEPYPGIRRAVFIAAPHRGSPVAGSGLGRIVQGLVGRRTPEIRILQRVARKNPEAVRDELRSAYLGGRINSITTLQASQPVMRAARALAPARPVPFHTIAGVVPGSDPPGDGVVPLASTVLEGAASTRIIASRHDVHEQDAAIEEILRILRQDLREQ